MKKILIWILCLVLLCGGALAQGEDAWTGGAPGERLGMELLSMLHVSGRNTLLSPQSLTLALGMAAEGAQGDTLAALLNALDVEDTEAITAELPEELKSANALFVKPGLALHEEYLQRLNEGYAAEQFVMDGEVVEKVNAWVCEHTDELIERMLSEEPAGDVGVLLLNAVAMDAKWENPFPAEATEKADFFTADGAVQAEMMHQTSFLDYAEKDGLQIVRLPYQDSSLEMWIILPEEGGMAQLLEQLAAQESLNYLRSDADMREVALSLPKFDLMDERSLAEALSLLGLESAFGESTDFSGMSDVPMCMDEILQKARVQVDEDGTRAAAATMIEMRVMAMPNPEPPVEMNVNRPFAFVIADGETGSICFAGAVENPAAAQ